MEVSSKMKMKAEEEAETTNNAVTMQSSPPPEPERSEEMETLRSKVRYKCQSKLHLFGLIYLVKPMLFYLITGVHRNRARRRIGLIYL
jgi:hypothetical protein